MLSLAEESPSLMVGGPFFSLCMNVPIKHTFHIVSTPFLGFKIAVFGLDRFPGAKSLDL